MQSWRYVAWKLSKTRARRSQMRQSETFEQHKLIFVLSGINVKVLNTLWSCISITRLCQNFAFPFSNFVCEQGEQGVGITSRAWPSLQSACRWSLLPIRSVYCWIHASGDLIREQAPAPHTNKHKTWPSIIFRYFTFVNPNNFTLYQNKVCTFHSNA